MNVLLHACCAPCTAGTISSLGDEGIRPVLYWNNPNIHPFQEYASRLGALRDYAAMLHLPLVIDGEYGLRPFLDRASGAHGIRCRECYAMRLDAAARHAAEGNYDAFTTTLLVSPYQDQGAIIDAGLAAAGKYGTSFLVRDFRPGFRDGQQRARELGLYMQKYCGCIFSEEERFEKKASKIPYGYHPNFGVKESMGAT